MNSWGAYVAGLLTLPVVVVLTVACIRAHKVLKDFFFKKYGIFVEVRNQKNYEGIDDYTLKHNIWFERVYGPVFVGHWCHHVYSEEKDYVNRWVGFGRTEGRSLAFYKTRALT